MASISAFVLQRFQIKKKKKMEGGGGGEVRGARVIFLIKIQLFKIFLGIWGWGGGGYGARVSIFLLTKNPIFYGRGWGTVSVFFKKKKNSNLKTFFRGKGMRDATVSFFLQRIQI